MMNNLHMIAVAGDLGAISRDASLEWRAQAANHKNLGLRGKIGEKSRCHPYLTGQNE